VQGRIRLGVGEGAGSPLLRSCCVLHLLSELILIVGNNVFAIDLIFPWRKPWTSVFYGIRKLWVRPLSCSSANCPTDNWVLDNWAKSIGLRDNCWATEQLVTRRTGHRYVCSRIKLGELDNWTCRICIQSVPFRSWRANFFGQIWVKFGKIW